MMITARSLTASCWTRGIVISAAKSACVRHVGRPPPPHARMLTWLIRKRSRAATVRGRAMQTFQAHV
eukprot:8853756-Prorocentrum_lima.AAC.1